MLRGLLEQAGQDEPVLAPARGLPLQQLVDMSRGQLRQSVVDDMVRKVNGGEMPEPEDTTGWTESFVAGRFTGRTVIVTGAASGT